jgi:2-iminobutanoate/2-iminopropanoate deaminase
VQVPRRLQDKTPLFNEALSYGNLHFIAGKGAGRGFQGDITAHTSRRERLEEALKNAGSSMEKVVKVNVNVYLQNPEDFEGMNTRASMNRSA